MSALVIPRVALVAMAATSAACWTWVMLEYGVHWWLAILAAGSAAGVVAGIRQTEASRSSTSSAHLGH